MDLYGRAGLEFLQRSGEQASAKTSESVPIETAHEDMIVSGFLRGVAGEGEGEKGGGGGGGSTYTHSDFYCCRIARCAVGSLWKAAGDLLV